MFSTFEILATFVYVPNNDVDASISIFKFDSSDTSNTFTFSSNLFNFCICLFVRLEIISLCQFSCDFHLAAHVKITLGDLNIYFIYLKYIKPFKLQQDEDFYNNLERLKILFSLTSIPFSLIGICIVKIC